MKHLQRKKINAKTLVLFMCILMPITVFAQGRSFIRQAIQNHGECRNVAITKTGGDLMIYGKNGFAQKGCPSSLVSKLNELNEGGHYIDDVQITENGRWVILYDDNGVAWHNLPQSLINKIREYNNEGERIDAITLNDDGEWVIVGHTKYASSDSDASQWLRDGEYQYGELWTVSLTDNAIVAVYSGGYKILGDIPESLRNALNETSIDIYRLKIAGSAWFFADKSGHYRYNM